MPLLDVHHLTVDLPTPSGWVRPVNDVSFSLDAGATLGLVGESGSGKTMLALSLLGLLPPSARRSGEALFNVGQAFSLSSLEGRSFSSDKQDDRREAPSALPEAPFQSPREARSSSSDFRPDTSGSNFEFPSSAPLNLISLNERSMRALCGSAVSMIFQEPMTALNPVLRIGAQIEEAIAVHNPALSKNKIRRRAQAALEQAAVPDPAARAAQFPHQLSGGLRQRALIAMALSCGPRLLIADEPTTALDVTIQAQILELLDRLQTELGMAVLLITHDLGVVAGQADRVVVMYAGQVVETASTTGLFDGPLHPYTEGLMAAVPRIDAPKSRLQAIPGQVPAATAWPSGCRFHPRCPHAWTKCTIEEPPLLGQGDGDHTARCWLVQEPGRRKAKT